LGFTKTGKANSASSKAFLMASLEVPLAIKTVLGIKSLGRFS
jgi:hypothetical protein